MDDAGDAVILEGLPELGADFLGIGGVHAGDDGLDLVLEDGLDDAGSAGDHAEGGTGPAGDACVRLDAEDDGSGVDAELVDGIVVGFLGWRGFEEVGFDAGDFELLLHCGDGRG